MHRCIKTNISDTQIPIYRYKVIQTDRKIQHNKNEKLRRSIQGGKRRIGKIIIIILAINSLGGCKCGDFWCIFAIKKLHRSGTDKIM